MTERVRNYRETPVDPSNVVTFTVYNKNSEAFKNIDESSRAELIIRGDSDTVAVEMLRSVTANIQHRAQLGGNFEILLRGTVIKETGTPLGALVMAEAEEEVIVRRKAWPIHKFAAYTNKQGCFRLDVRIGPDATPDNCPDCVPLLTPLDLVSCDWEVVAGGNPNIEEIDIDDDDDDYDEP